jgi:hypothetical protein
MVIEWIRGLDGLVGEGMCESDRAVMRAEREPPTCGSC